MSLFICYTALMEIIATLKESEIYTNSVLTPENQYGEPRKAVRVVLFDEDDKVALGYYTPRENSFGGYNIPGGGIENSEDVQEALVRESREETGCSIKDVEELGIINEFGVGKKTKHFQENYCFIAKVDGGKSAPKFTSKETGEGLELKWVNLDEAIEKVKLQNDNFEKRKTLILLEKARQFLSIRCNACRSTKSIHHFYTKDRL